MSESWCPACLELCPPQPDRICYTCGEELISSPSSQQSSQSLTPRESQRGNNRQRESQQDQTNDAAATRAMSLLASSMENSIAVDASALQPLVDQLRDQPNIEEGGRRNTNNFGNNGDISDLAGLLPPEALNPQAGSANHRPVSSQTLNNMKRVVLTPQSSELFDAHIVLFDKRPIDDLSPLTSTPDSTNKMLTLNAVPGEFGPLSSLALKGENSTKSKESNQHRSNPASRTAALVVCSPRTTKGGLSSRTLSQIESLRQHRMPFVAYVERGDGITFVQKALICQRAGQVENTIIKGTPSHNSLCIGVIVGNRASGAGTNEIWPYVMQDTKNEARRDDGARLVQKTATKETDVPAETCMQYTPCQIQIHSKHAHSHTCPVCTDSYVPGATIVRLPLCGHLFHESCALSWLTKHNTCPYCRKEYPTDDEDYERERRRREAGGSASGGADDSASNGHNFYG